MRAIAVGSMAIMAAACSEGGVVVSEVATEPGPTTDSPFVTLPSPDTFSSTVPVTTAPETTSPPSTTTQSETVDLVTWDWGLPCRVPAMQRWGPDNLAPERTLDVVVTATSDGFRMTFENVTAMKGSVSDELIAQYLLEAAAVLPATDFDEEGNFLAFADLPGELTALVERAGQSGTVTPDEAEFSESFIRDQTFAPWFGYWLGRTGMELIGSPSTESQSRFGISYDADVTVSGARISSDVQRAEFGDDAARLAYREVGEDLVVGPDEAVAYDVDATSIIDVTTARPFETTVWLTLFSTSDGRRTNPFFDSEFHFVVQTWFDWENAEGCE